MTAIRANQWQNLSGTKYHQEVQVKSVILGQQDHTQNLGANLSNDLSYVVVTNTTTWTTYTPMDLTITPKFSNSVIELDLSLFAGSDGTDSAINYRIVRGSTVIWQPQTNSSGPYGGGYTTSGVRLYQQRIYVTDTPNTTSPVTYRIQYRGYNNNIIRIASYDATGGQWSPINTFTATEYAQ